MTEAIARMRARPNVQILATDIDEPMLQKARKASYHPSAVRDVPLELMDRYFYAQEDDYVLSPAIRDMVRVSNHNLIKDPPFSRIDLVVCRNLLIYLNTSLQQRLIPVFHYALKPQGWLFLGPAENIAARNDLFDAAEPALKIYRRRGAQRQSVAMPLFVQPLTHAEPEIALERKRNGQITDRADLTVRRMMERYAPPHVVINSDNDIVRASGRTSKYLELAEGTPSQKVTDLAKRGLRSAVRAVVDSARSTKKRSVKRDVRIDGDEDAELFVDVIADPLSDDELLLVFQDVAASRQDDDAVTDARVDAYTDEDRIRQLEDELDETRTKLRVTVEELETSNEELKSSNEEMMSMNEELQSTNEELATVNEELKNKVDQLARANSDLQNFIESTQVPTIFVDRKMRIRSFTPATRSLFRFQDQDKGRPLSDVVSRTDHRQLEELGRKVLETGEGAEEELSLEEGQESHVLRVLPYRDLNDAIDGVIFVFSDVTNVRKAQADLARNEGLARQRSHEIETLYETAPVGMAMVDRNRRFLKINQHFAELNGQPIEKHIGRTLEEMLPGLSERMERPIAEVFDQASSVTNLEASMRLEGEAARDFVIDVYPYQEEGIVRAVGIVLKDMTELRRLEKDLRQLMDELQHRVKNTLATVASIVSQSIAGKSDPAEVAKSLKMRIGALAATHNLLTLRHWRDVSLLEILKAELKPFDHEDRITMEGPAVLLPPKAALTMTLTLHELATNAAKYGALAHNGARLEISWVVNEDGSGRTLRLEWREINVPIDPALKIKKSFGTRLIKNAVVHDLQGQCEHRLEADGLRCTIQFPF